MCIAALDYYHAGRPVPGQTNPPADSTPLYLYLVKRQLAGLALPQVPLQVMAWMLTVKIGLYDPNQPGQAPSPTLSLRGPFAEPGLTETSDMASRGFFVLNYQPKLPPGN